MWVQKVLSFNTSTKHIHDNTFTEHSPQQLFTVQLKVKVQINLTSQWEFTPTYPSKAKPIIIHRSDIEKLLAYPKKPRNQLIHELAALMGFRTGEICTERIEWMDYESGKCMVEDSKKRQFYPIPLNYEVAKLATKVAAGRTEGLLIRRFESYCYGKNSLNTPLTIQDVWGLTRRHARKAGIKNWREVNPRLLRHYFAATFAKGKDGNPGNMEVLRRILRHTSLLSTQFYLARLIFFEDVQDEYDRIHTLPIEKEERKLSVKMLDSAIAEQCRQCPAKPVCKHVEEAINSEWAAGCKFYAEIMAEAKR